jgi:hypothetical protein
VASAVQFIVELYLDDTEPQAPQHPGESSTIGISSTLY